MLEDFFSHCRNFEIQNVLVSKQRMLLSWKVVNRNKFFFIIYQLNGSHKQYVNMYKITVNQ